MKGLKIARETDRPLGLPAPRTVVIDDHMPRYLINPRQQPTVVLEAAKPSLHPQEDLLREIQRFVVIPQQVERQLVDHALMLVDQVGARILVVRGAALNQQRLSAADLRPGDGSNRLHGETFRHLITRQQ